MKKYFLLLVAILMLANCAPSSESIQTAIAQTQTVSTPVPTQTPIVVTQVITQMVTKVIVRTPTPSGTLCEPITGVTYSDMSKVIIQLQAYVSQMPDVVSVSYVIPERLYSNADSELVHVRFVHTDGNVYSHRYIIYLKEFGWKTGIFSIDGQCWIDPPH